MSSVQVFHIAADGATTLVGVYDGDHVKAHSTRLRKIIAERTPAVIYRIELYEGSPDGLRVVLNEIQSMRQGEYLEITTNTRDLNKAINIHNAIEILEVEPEQSKITGHINGYIAHQLISAEEMIAIHKNYGTPNHSHVRIWNTMIHTIAYKYVGGDIEQKDVDVFKVAAMEYPALDDAIEGKVREFQRVRKSKALTMERRAAKRAKKEAKKAAKANK